MKNDFRSTNTSNLRPMIYTYSPMIFRALFDRCHQRTCKFVYSIKISYHRADLDHFEADDQFLLARDVVVFEMSEPEKARVFPKPPERKVISPNDMHLWIDSQAYVDYMRFVRELNCSVKGLLMSDCPPANENVKGILEVLKILHSWIDEIPLAPETARFGNKAFRIWQSRLEENAESLIRQHILKKTILVNELKPYLTNSFGNSTRIDYGTGHEVSFLMFLLCLWKVGYFDDTSTAVLVLRIFDAYIKLCRRLQMTYKLEPAGSHGAWCLDDYQFCPFLFGSSQLIGNSDFLPRSLCEPDIIRRYADDYMLKRVLLQNIQMDYIPFAQYRIGETLTAAYFVLKKFPVAQHFLFGILLSVEPAGSPCTTLDMSEAVKLQRNK
ncbi:Serine/threonine-protein phosphatase 2A activator [Trichinella spiralis]|uniref:Serine/threonine-protein phosphatase 2A activator n=1 Tax=Trichinella spiralis TaxID=6334 RepID=A0A0V1BS10_TRISP|nr:Serine/threonine-protein phosphatase 2A activator [Trichinella spiralis]